MSDYEKFVKRMGSFDMELSLDDVGPNKEELQHYGILGMKWGVRRSREQLARARAKREGSDDYKTAKKLSKKKRKDLSNAELKTINERKQLENQNKQLNPKNVSKGVAYVATATAVLSTAMNFYNTSKNTINAGVKISEKISKSTPIKKLITKN